MFVVLQENPDPMGGGPAFNYVATFSTKEVAETWIERKLQTIPPANHSWSNYRIAQVVG